MHFRAILGIYNKKNKFLNERKIYIRTENITGVLDIIKKIKGARWQTVNTIDLLTYLDGVKKAGE